MKLYYLKIIFGVIFLLSINIFADSRERDLEPKCIRKEIERLKEIRNRNPEKYNQELYKYKKSLRAKMQDLQKNNPDKYKEIKFRILRQKYSFLNENPDKDPDKRVNYSTYTNRLHSRLLFLKENDPESYERLRKRISKEREKRFKGKGQTPPPHPLFDQTPGGKHEKFRNSDDINRKKLQRKVSEIKAKIDLLPPEQRAEATTKLEKKLSEKHENFNNSGFNNNLRDGSKEPRKSR
jgi:hypothetical protein